MSLESTLRSAEKFNTDLLNTFNRQWSTMESGLQKSLLSLFRTGNFSTDAIQLTFQEAGFDDLAGEVAANYNKVFRFSKQMSQDLGYKFVLTEDNIKLFDQMNSLNLERLLNTKQAIAADLKRFSIEATLEGRTIPEIRRGYEGLFEKMGRNLNAEITTGIRSYSSAIDMQSMITGGIEKFRYAGPFDGKTRDTCTVTLSDPRQQTGWTVADIQSSETPFIQRGGFNCRHIWVAFVGESVQAGNIDKSASDASKSILKNTGNKFEQAIVLNNKGQTILSKSGGKSQVSFNSDDIAKIKDAQVFTHNHPSGNSFSPEDIFMAGQNNIKDMRAIVENGARGSGEYTIKVTGFDNQKTIGKFKRVFSDAEDNIPKKIGQMIRDGKIKPQDGMLLHWDEIWKVVSKEMGWEYGFIKG